jgi:hypothetical protein
LFGEDSEKKRFAVRSSAVGEDGEELSSAGQNITVLGCQGFESIMAGLQKCWASLLSYQSVEYRRQHGEPLIPGIQFFTSRLLIDLLNVLCYFPFVQEWEWLFRKWLTLKQPAFSLLSTLTMVTQAK